GVKLVARNVFLLGESSGGRQEKNQDQQRAFHAELLDQCKSGGTKASRPHFPSWFELARGLRDASVAPLLTGVQGMAISLRSFWKTSNSIFSVSLPVLVFCREGW